LRGVRCHLPSESGVIVFSERDALYEDQMTETLRVPAFERTRGPLRAFATFDFLVSQKQVRPRFLYDAVSGLRGPQPLAVLDVGCGGGKEVLTRLGPVAGVDISLRALANARRMYDVCVRHDVRAGLPFPDASFDVVNCSDVLGHFHESERDRLLDEIHRVLRPGGSFLAFIETWSAVYDANRARFPDWYPQFLDVMVAKTGHIELEPHGVALRRLEGRGFDAVRLELLSSRWGYARGHLPWPDATFPAPSVRHAILRGLASLAVRTQATEAALDDALGILEILSRGAADARDSIAILVHARAARSTSLGP